MRGNLVGVWRQPAVQEQNKTKRKEKDIRAEVLRGYEVARSVVDARPGEAPRPLGAGARRRRGHARREQLPPGDRAQPEVLPEPRPALDEFRRAARLYAAKVPTLSEDDETARAFELWFYAGLGACDLPQIDEKTQPDPRQPP